MGGPSKASKQAALQQQQLQVESGREQLEFDKQLMGLFKDQFQYQRDQFSHLQNILNPEIERAQAGQGFSEEALTAMRTSASDTLSQKYANAQQALNEQLRSAGVTPDIASGTAVSANQALAISEAQEQAAAQNQITLANQGQAQSNLWSALNSLQGIAAQNQPGYLASTATQGTGTEAALGSAQANLLGAQTQASQAGFGGAFMNAFGQRLGAGKLFG